MKDQQFWKKSIGESAVLSPVDRISEILFGLIMVLTFTGAISAATSGRQEVRELLWAALGCNVAWGLVDAIMYLMNVLVERGHQAKLLKDIVSCANENDARTIMRDAMPPAVSALLGDEELDRMKDRLVQLPPLTGMDLFSWRDILAGVEIFLLVFLCTLPVALPFVFSTELGSALRISNGIALLQLFVGGFLLAGYAGFRRLPTAIIYTLIGVALVSVTMALGG